MEAFMRAHDLSPAEWARQAGLSNANAIYNFLGGRSSSMRQRTLEQLADAVPGATVAEVIGEARAHAIRPVLMPVRVTASAGGWRSSYEAPHVQEIEIPMPPNIPADEVAKILDGHADRIYPQGSYVTTQGIAAMPRALRGGDIVLVHRVRDGRHEVTVRELRERTAEDGSTVAELVFLTHNPKLAGVTVPVPMPYQGQLFEVDGSRIQIRGRVVMMTVVHDTMD